MQIPMSMLLSFALQASFVPNIGARRLSDKSPKSAKRPKSICLEKASLYEIEPDFEGIASPQNVYETCCEEWDEFATTPWTADPNTNLISIGACAKDLELSKSFNECINEYQYSYPFRHYVNHKVGDNEFQFVTTSDALLGETAFRGKIATDAGTGKVILQYESSPPYEEDIDSLAGRPLSDLEYIEYNFKTLSCHTAATAGPCPGKFYLNVYATADPPRRGSTGWYDCAFDFTPTEGGVVNGDWTTIRYSFDSSPDSGSRCNGNACNECPGGTSWGDVASSNYDYKMGASSDGDYKTIFALNMGDGRADDGALEGLFDRVIVKLKDEDPRVYDL